MLQKETSCSLETKHIADPGTNTNRITPSLLVPTFGRLSVGVPKHLILVAEDIIVDIEFVCNRALEEKEEK